MSCHKPSSVGTQANENLSPMAYFLDTCTKQNALGISSTHTGQHPVQTSAPCVTPRFTLRHERSHMKSSKHV